MATANAVNKTKIAAGGSGDNYIPSNEYGGEVKSIYDTYEASGLATGNTIAIANLPNTAKVVGVLLAWDALGTSSTIALGDALDADRYVTAVSSVAAGVSTSLAMTGINYEVGTTATDNVPLITVTTSASINGTIKVVIFYV